MARRKKASKTPQVVKPKGLSPVESKAYDAAIAASQSTGWTPAFEGDCIVGTYVGSREIRTQHGECDTLDMKTEELGVVSLIAGKVLSQEILRVKPKVGDRLILVYKGMAPSKVKGRNPAKLFALSRVGKS